MSRIELPVPETMNPEQRAVYDRLIASRGKIGGPFRVALVRPEIAERMQQVGLLYKDGAKLTPKLRELLILVTARFWNAKFEWWNHVATGLKAGLSEEVLFALRDKRRPPFKQADEAAVYDFLIELYEKHKVSQANHDRIVALIGTVGAVELSTAAGYYSMAAFMLIAHDIGIPVSNISDLETMPD